MVYIHGEGFSIIRTVNVAVTSPSNDTDSDSATSGLLGRFKYSYDPTGVYGTYVVYATDGPNSATASFTGGSVSVDFKQYANLDDLWLGGIVRASNSRYAEGESVPQRLLFNGIQHDEQYSLVAGLLFLHRGHSISNMTLGSSGSGL